MSESQKKRGCGGRGGRGGVPCCSDCCITCCSLSGALSPLVDSCLVAAHSCACGLSIKCDRWRHNCVHQCHERTVCQPALCVKRCSSKPSASKSNFLQECEISYESEGCECVVEPFLVVEPILVVVAPFLVHCEQQHGVKHALCIGCAPPASLHIRRQQGAAGSCHVEWEMSLSRVVELEFRNAEIAVRVDVQPKRVRSLALLLPPNSSILPATQQLFRRLLVSFYTGLEFVFSLVATCRTVCAKSHARILRRQKFLPVPSAHASSAAPSATLRYLTCGNSR